MLSLSFMEVPLLTGGLWDQLALFPSGALTIHVLMDRTVPSNPSPAGPPPRAPPRGPLLSLWHPEFPDSSAQLCGLLGNILSLAAWTLTARKVGTGNHLRVDTARGQAHSSWLLFLQTLSFSSAAAWSSSSRWCGDSDPIPSERAEFLLSPLRT